MSIVPLKSIPADHIVAFGEGEQVTAYTTDRKAFLGITKVVLRFVNVTQTGTQEQFVEFPGDFLVEDHGLDGQLALF